MKASNPTIRKPLIEQIKAQWQWYALLLPSAIYLFLFNYVPMYGIQIAFRNYRPSKGIWGSQWVGLKYFQQFISFRNFGMIVGNTAVISMYSLLTFPLAIILALLLNELKNQRFKKVVQMVTYAPHFISTVVMVSMLNLFLSRSNGLLNNIIALMGGTRIAFLESTTWFPSIYVWSDVWQHIGFSTIIYIAALGSVSPEIHEAALIDGASRFQIMMRINLPCIMPTVIITLILRCGSILAVGFEKIYLMQNSMNLDVSQVISTYVYEIGLRSGQFSYSAAIGLFNTVINVAMLLIVNCIARKVSDVSLW